jgi:hypothetical protein
MSVPEPKPKRGWNLPIWFGFLLVVAGFFSYPVFVQLPATRDIPWVDFVLFAAGLVLLAIGLKRAFRQPAIYRGKIFGPILAALGMLVVGFFSYVIFYELRQVPASTGAPRVGQKAPEFTLADQDDRQVSLADLLFSPASNTSTTKPNAVVLIFYRGFW